MKKQVFFKFFSLFFVAGIMLLITGCPSKNDNNDPSGGSKFAGTYSVDESCTYGNDSYEIEITAGSEGTSVTIFNLYNWNENATASVSGNNITIPSQLQDNITISGSGTLSGNTLTIDLEVSDEFGTGNCELVCTKQ